MKWAKEQAKRSRVVDAQSPLAIVIPARDSCLSTTLRESDISRHDFLDRARNYRNYKEPKGIPWTLATPYKAGADGCCHTDVHNGDIVAWPTNLGWMMGRWLIYASLLNGGSAAL
ncbi:AMP-binding, conserved site-containing protein [Artemisia annua]|uniref:AMP-binding, conserved site-containing protein n=1 Tax=Artemisia annua TaxID=35608 RepID=A0A2U1M2G9_ARTAN|nr:AMP-binding, conserved site-containing protein [Artemisia annua]